MKHFILHLFLLNTLLALTGCSRRDNPEAADVRTSPWKSYIPGESDLLIVADMDALRKSQWYQAGDDDSRSRALLAAAGFSYDDISDFVLSSDIDAMPSVEALKGLVRIDANGQPDTSSLSGADMPAINAKVLLSLKKAITWTQAVAAANVFFESVTNATVTEMEDRQAVIVKQSSSQIPLVITLSSDRQTLILETGTTAGTMSSADSIRSLFAREDSIKTNGPVRIVMQASEAMQKKLRQAAEPEPATSEQDAASVALGSVMRSFSSFRGFSLALTPSRESAQVYGEIEMGSETEALDAETKMKNILIPIITLALAQSEQSKSEKPLLQKTSTDVSGNKMIVRAVFKSEPRQSDGTSPN